MSEQNYDVVPRDDVVILVDEDGQTLQADRTDDGALTDDLPSDAVHALEESNEVEVAGSNSISFPQSTKYSVHLEDTVLRSLERELGTQLTEVFEEYPSLPSIEIRTTWEVDADGKIELEGIKYNGTLYTPEN